MWKTYQLNEIGNYGVIYCLTSPSGKCYIGQTWRNPLTRWQEYRGFHKNINKQPKILRAINKYGFESFKKEIIDLCETQDEMDNKEKFYIEIYDSYKNGYNSSIGGLTHEMTEEIRNKISTTLKSKNIKRSDETKRKIGISSKNRPHLKIFAENRKFMKITDNMKDKISKSLIKYHETRGLKKYKITNVVTGEILIVTRLTEFCKNNKLRLQSFYDIMSGKIKSYKNYLCEKYNE